MKIAALFFAAWATCLISAPQPAPSGQKAANTAQQQSKSNKHPPQPTPSASPNAEENTAQHPANQNGGAIKGGEDERAVRVVSLPPRSTGDTIALVCTVVLTLVGIVGIVAAFCTLTAIVRDADATQEAARATQASVELQKTAMEQWIDTDDWTAGPITPYAAQKNAPEGSLPISFNLGNPTKFKMTLNYVEIWINRRRAASCSYGNLLLVPEGEPVTVRVERKLTGVNLEAYRKGVLRLEIGVIVRYIDAFREAQVDKIGRYCICSVNDSGEFETIAFRPPDEAELREQNQNAN